MSLQWPYLLIHVSTGRTGVHTFVEWQSYIFVLFPSLKMYPLSQVTVHLMLPEVHTMSPLATLVGKDSLKHASAKGKINMKKKNGKHYNQNGKGSPFLQPS